MTGSPNRILYHILQSFHPLEPIYLFARSAESGRAGEPPFSGSSSACEKNRPTANRNLYPFYPVPFGLTIGGRVFSFSAQILKISQPILCRLTIKFPLRRIVPGFFLQVSSYYSRFQTRCGLSGRRKPGPNSPTGLYFPSTGNPPPLHKKFIRAALYYFKSSAFSVARNFPALKRIKYIPDGRTLPKPSLPSQVI